MQAEAFERGSITRNGFWRTTAAVHDGVLVDEAEVVHLEVEELPGDGDDAFGDSPPSTTLWTRFTTQLEADVEGSRSPWR